MTAWMAMVLGMYRNKIAYYNGYFRLFKIKNGDELCCARAIVTAIAHYDHHSDRQHVGYKRKYDRIRQGDKCKDQKVG